MAELPGGSGYGVLGDKSFDFYKDPVSFVKRNADEHKSRVFLSRFLMKPTVIVASNEATWQLLNEKSSFFEMGYKEDFYELFGDVIFFAEGPEAEALREVIRPLFCHGFLQKRFGVVQTITRQWMDGLQTEEPFCIYTELKALAMNLVLGLFLNIDPSTSQELVQEIISLATNHWHGVITVPLNNKVPVFSTASYKKAISAKERLLAIIRERLGEDSDHSETTCNHLLLAISSLIPKALASLWTSFVTSSHLWYKECTDKQGRLIEEELDFLLLEIERCWPPFVGGRRIALQDCELAGYSIPAGTAMFYVAIAANRDPTVFPNPDAFWPDRWKTCNAGHENRIFTFGSGARNCVASLFVNELLKHVCRRVNENFYWESTGNLDQSRKWFPVARHKQLPMIRLFRKPPH